MKKLITIILMAVFFNVALAEVEIYYHDNGQKSFEGNDKNGKADGLWAFWYENGKKRYERNFKNGKRHGLWTTWHYKNGKIVLQKCYQHGDEVNMSNCSASNIAKTQQQKTQQPKTQQPKTQQPKTNDYANMNWWKNATLEQVKRAIADGLSPNQLFGNDGETTLHLATYSQNPEIVEYVIKSGADIDAINIHGNTPLDYLKYNKNNKVADTLIKISKILKYKRTPIATECVSIINKDRQMDKFKTRHMKNTCDFYIQVWNCDEKKNGCGASKGLYSEGVNQGTKYGYTRFNRLVGLEAGKQTGTGGIGSTTEHVTNYFACKGRFSHIYNNKKGETKFGCNTRESLLEKYGWGNNLNLFDK